MPVKRGDFGPVAGEYARARPGYPPAVVDHLAAHVGLAPGDRIAELGAGTGLFTTLLAGRGYEVTALEPDAEMRDRAPALAGVTRGAGTFEATGLPSHSQRWVVAAQSFHFSHPERALPEIRRILEPGRWFTTIWNHVRPEGEPLVAWTLAALHRHIPEYRFPDQRGRALRAGARMLSRLPRAGQVAFDRALRLVSGSGTLGRSGMLLTTRDFGRPVYHEVEHRVPMSAERFVGLWRSYIRVQSVGRPGAFEAFLGELSEHLATRGGDVIEVPYVCITWSARSRGT